MIKFYSITFKNNLGMEHDVFVIGTQEQSNDWAIKEASSYGLTYNVKYLGEDCPENLTGGIKNLCNY